MQRKDSHRINRHPKTWLTALCVAIVGACNVTFLLPPLAAPQDTTPVVGGIVDTRPMFGKTIAPDGAEIGEFLLATCGCGDWRILIQDADGRQEQCAIRYFTTGEYESEGDIAFFGDEDTIRALGVVNQTTGDASGDVDVDIFRRRFSATRREVHTDDIEACILCHIGSNPIYPQPPEHTPYIEGMTNCFDCHDVVIE
ncbi:MAG: hypothetical protein H6818_13270 [Phycisphaerales bacterium]|nr:hypothetical protein [Phycisphaerales bacterium]